MRWWTSGAVSRHHPDHNSQSYGSVTDRAKSQMASSKGYDRLPQHMRPNSNVDADMRRYLTEEERRRMHPQQAEALARERMQTEMRQSQGMFAGAQDDPDTSYDESVQGKPRRSFYRATADLSRPEDAEERERVWNWLWYTHGGSALAYFLLGLSMIVFMGVYNWGDDHHVGKFPLETNFLHDVMGMPVSVTTSQTHLAFFWVLFWIPVAGTIFHGLHLPRSYFSGYFNDNVIHHVGSLKHLFFGIVWFLISWTTYVLVGVLDLPLLVAISLLAANAHAHIQSVVWQNGRNRRHQLSQIVSVRTKAAAVFSEVMGVNPDAPDSIYAGGPMDDAAATANQAVNDSARLVTDAASATGTLVNDAVGLTPNGARRAINRFIQEILPPDLVVAPFYNAGVNAIISYLFVLLYWGEALANAGWHELPWIANFAAIYYLLPLIVFAVTFALYFFQVGYFQIYAYHEIGVIGLHTAMVIVFVALVFFFSTRYGTIYV